MVVLSGKPEPDAHVAGKFPHKIPANMPPVMIAGRSLRVDVKRQEQWR